MTNLSVRQLNLVGFICCAGMMAYALYAEYVLLLMPCPLCILERVAVIAMGIIFFIAAVHNPATLGRRVYSVLLLLAAGSGVGVASRHVWLQSLPPDEVPACGGAGLSYLMETLPLTDVLATVFTGSGECAVIDWQFLGLSMPAWVLISAGVIGIAGLWNNLRPAS